MAVGEAKALKLAIGLKAHWLIGESVHRYAHHVGDGMPATCPGPRSRR